MCLARSHPFLGVPRCELGSAAVLSLTSWPLLWMSNPVRYVVIQDGNIADYRRESPPFFSEGADDF